MPTSGKIKIDASHEFLWMSGKDGEISGFTENVHTRQILKGSYGWYRTNDAEQAAKIALSNLKEYLRKLTQEVAVV